uniref:Uncharacterized protein n=1 Tax=Aegilops tauschii subsp. strangulata TaxID=200361 RepID=A0A453CHF2_AEGTS
MDYIPYQTRHNFVVFLVHKFKSSNQNSDTARLF